MVDGHTDALWESRGGAPRAPLSEASGTHGLSRGATGRSWPCSPRPGSGVSALRFAPAASRQAGSVPRARVKRLWEWRASASDKGEEEGAGSSSIKGTTGAGVGGIADGAPLAPRLHGDHYLDPETAPSRHQVTVVSAGGTDGLRRFLHHPCSGPTVTSSAVLSWSPGWKRPCSTRALTGPADSHATLILPFSVEANFNLFLRILKAILIA